MKTQNLYTFIVRKSFDRFNVGDTFEASVRTFVHDFKELQDFVFPDGAVIRNVSCDNTEFYERRFKKK